MESGTTQHLRLDMIPQKGTTLMYENELLLADNIGKPGFFHQVQSTDPKAKLKTDFVMLLFCISGTMHVQLNRSHMVLEKNQVLLVTPNDITEAQSMGQDAEIFIIGIANQDYFEDLYSRAQLDSRHFYLRNRILKVQEEDMQEYHLFYKLLRHRLSSEDFIPKKDLVTKGLSLMGVIMHNTILQVDKNLRQGLSQRDQQVYERFMSLVRKHFRSQHNIGFYADSLCLSPKYLSQVIHSASGHFASYWINGYLLDEAKSLLLSGSHTAAQVADLLGFASPSYFNRFFKRETGLTPHPFQKR